LDELINFECKNSMKSVKTKKPVKNAVNKIKSDSEKVRQTKENTGFFLGGKKHLSS